LTTPKKFGTSMESLCVDGRLRGQFKFFGAHTGRWSGQNVQLQNLTRSALKPDKDFQDRLALRTTLTKDQKEKLEARETLRLVEAAILDLKMGFGADQNTLKSLVRAMFIGPFVVCDYSAIEARVLAWLAGEQWVLDAFLSGKDIYVETAERMSTETKKMTRFDGKVATLALGYQGAVGALARMGAVGTEQELVTLVKQWRKTNPNIVKFWYDLERVFKRGGKAGRITVETDGPHRHVILPSGRRIIYHNVKMVGDRLTFADPAGYRTDVYGGKLSENVTQAVARDILAEALVRCHEAGVKVVMHIHDEIVAEGCTKDELEKLMVHQPDWADGLPLDAEGEGPMERYQKL
jgi:DNA polymerase